MRWIFAPLALALALDGCSTGPPPKVEENILPGSNYRDRIIMLLRPKLDDPTGIRGAFIAEPALQPFDKITRYVVCFRYDARGRDGKYLGNKDKAAVYYRGEITQIVDADRELCGAAKFQPWPELEKLCRELTCPKRQAAAGLNPISN